jgi:hypothetical protein
MPAQVGRIAWHCNGVAHAGGNLLVTSRTDICLQCFVRLHTSCFHLTEVPIPDIASHGAQPKNAQATSAADTTMAMVTNQISVLRGTCLRVGLNPMLPVSLRKRRSVRSCTE